jgi:suppressor of ftsI
MHRKRANQSTHQYAAHERQIWRIFNVSANMYYNLQLDGQQLYQIGVDGVYYKMVKAWDSILMPPGSKIELLVQAKRTGEFKLKTWH